jgi:hypothetical protein
LGPLEEKGKAGGMRTDSLSASREPD